MTHAEAFARRRPHLPPSDCPGELRPRALRPGDRVLACALCHVSMSLDGGGVVVWAAYNGTPLAKECVDDAKPGR